MEQIFVFKPTGTCSRSLIITYEDGIIKKFEAVGGCSGNLAGIGRLVEGQPIKEVAEKLTGVHCGTRSTSCPDQLSIALKAILAQKAE